MSNWLNDVIGEDCGCSGRVAISCVGVKPTTCNGARNNHPEFMARE
jgi:hypothetical protein